MGDEDKPHPDLQRIDEKLRTLSAHYVDPFEVLAQSLFINASDTDTRLSWLEDQMKDLRVSLNQVIEAIGELQERQQKQEQRLEKETK